MKADIGEMELARTMVTEQYHNMVLPRSSMSCKPDRANTRYIFCGIDTFNFLNESVSGAIRGIGHADIRGVMAMGMSVRDVFTFHYGP